MSSDLIALQPYAIKPTGRVFIHPGFFYLVDTSAYSGNVTFLCPPSNSSKLGDRWKIKKVSSDSNGIAITPWPGDNINGSTSPATITTFKTSHEYVNGCPSSYGGAPGSISW